MNQDPRTQAYVTDTVAAAPQLKETPLETEAEREAPLLI